MAKPNSHSGPDHSPAQATKATVVVQSPSELENTRWTETLRDGSHVIVRPLREDDIELERAFIQRLSPQSRRMRFLGQMSSPSDELLHRLTDLDYVREMAFVALVHRDGEKQEVGVSRYSVAPDGKSCECAVAVADAWHDKGLGTLLMRHLIDVARRNGIRSMVSYDAADNLPMRDLAVSLGFTRHTDPDDAHQVIHRLQL